jgi:phage repressor protein C with HTH and peptisase S24 domain
MSTTVENNGFRSRLTQLLQQLGSVAEAARAVGVSDNAIYKWLSGRGQPSVTNLVALARAGRVSVEWLATGHETVRAKHPSGRSTQPDEYVFVPRYNVRSSATRGDRIQSQQIVDYLAFKADWVRSRLNTDPRNLLLIEAAGDSMSPTLEDSDLLLVDLREPRFKHDGVYVLRRNGDLVVKRLQRRPDGKVVIRSDNPAYEPQVVTAESVRVIGRAIWAARRL